MLRFIERDYKGAKPPVLEAGQVLHVECKKAMRFKGALEAAEAKAAFYEQIIVRLVYALPEDEQRKIIGLLGYEEVKEPQE